jgi:hypothetical protein
MAEMKVGIDTLGSLHRLKCSQCGAGGKHIKVELMEDADLGG